MYIPNLADAKRWNDSDEQWTLIVDEFAAEANEAIYAHSGFSGGPISDDAGYDRVDDIEEAFVTLLQEASISVRDNDLPFEHKDLRD